MLGLSLMVGCWFKLGTCVLRHTCLGLWKDHVLPHNKSSSKYLHYLPWTRKSPRRAIQYTQFCCLKDSYKKTLHLPSDPVSWSGPSLSRCCWFNFTQDTNLDLLGCISDPRLQLNLQCNVSNVGRDNICAANYIIWLLETCLCKPLLYWHKTTHSSPVKHVLHVCRQYVINSSVQH